ncbi:beta-ketoacyl synthase chain length factor [Colwellia sp. RSH04]|uniref:beta-ketoacyl synthase chain length factor n=1 Tax=Colwellia sp. RSH04 TaxID=2305464 RepID=UPI000E58CADA|nr:beta-ketoacyl synthase chain length factor [Colwellia sp. RSH04]RHW75785.1 hypothetical protein D1094_11740 [Colwellia sp. RSH04]
MKLYINKIHVWLNGLNDSTSLNSWANGDIELPNTYALPKPAYYPKTQLRRLSPFSRVALHCLDMPQVLTASLPLIFASRHGDLAKTVKLIKDSASGEDLSPTQFALSVHNATSGLFGIATKNTTATTTISASKNTFIEGLIEALMQCQKNHEEVLYCYCDFDVPDEYRQYEEKQPARCIALLLSAVKSKETLVSIDLSPNSTLSNKKSVQSKQETPPCIDFIRHMYCQSQENIACKNYTLSLGFH